MGVIPTDAIFTPIRRVNYEVSATRVGRQTNLDKLTLQIWTNGVVKPREALDEAGRIFRPISFRFMNQKLSVAAESNCCSCRSFGSVLRMTVDELDLPTRIYNSLRNGGIETIGQLLDTPRKELIGMRNMGGKSIGVIEEKLKEKGISLQV